MASVCKRQQCTIDRRGFRQELDSWRHKLIHCVGFESILEGLFDPELVEDLKLFKDFEPTAVSDWSFDENCLFCCLRRDKVKEHLIGISDEELEDRPKPLLVKDQTTISRLEQQAEEFINAVLLKKDVPNFSDPHIPVVAREILQRMIRQFAAEYTSKNGSPQDSHKDFQPHSDQSMATPPLLSRVSPSTSPTATLTGPAHNQNPVLSKLLMADQDAPLDLTIKKPLALPSDQDGVLDLSIKKDRNSLPVHSQCLSSTFKGEYPDLCVSKAKDLQSTSTLELFMAKLCPHHQRQMVDAIGFLQAEVKALTSSNTQQNSKGNSGVQGTACSTAKSSAGTPEKPCLEFTPKSEVQDVPHSTPTSSASKKVTENAVSLKTSMNAEPALDLHQPGSGSNQPLVTLANNRVDTDNNRHGDHAPLRMKIMTSNVADGKKLSCVLNTSISSHSDILDDREENSIPSSRTETHSARLSSSVKRHSQTSHTLQAKQRETVRQTKDTPAKLFSVHVALPSDSPRTARKTVRASPDDVIRGSVCMGLTDPDLGHCDIVFIDKPITECFKKKHRGMLPRRNARKSTRGHMYSDEIWELKTVRTLAGRGKCPNPMPEMNTLVVPKQMRSKPEGVPPLDMPIAAVCSEAMNQQLSTEESDDHVVPDTGDVVEVAVSEGVDVIVETSQTDQCQNREQSNFPSSISCPTENKDTNINTDVEQNTVAVSGITTENEENVAPVHVEPERENDHEPQENICESTKQIVTVKVVEELKDITTEEIEPLPSREEQLNGDSIQLVNSAPSAVNEVEENKREEMQVEQPQELQAETDNREVTREFNTTGSAEEITMKEPEIKMIEVVETVMPSDTDDGTDTDDLSSKTLDALLKELPPWRRKKGTVISLPKRLRTTEAVIVGYVNGRPVSSSDRSLRRRSSNSTLSPVKNPVKSIQKAPNTTSLDSAIDSSFVNEYVDKNVSVEHTPAEPCETTRVIQQVQEPTPATPPSSTSKCSSSIQQIRKQKRVQRYPDSSPIPDDQPIDCPQSTEPKRQLRSAGQKSAGTLASPSTSKSVTSISSPKTSDNNAPPSTQHLHSSPLASPLPDTSPPIRSSPPAPSEQQDAVPEKTVESNIEKTVPQAVIPKEIEKQECKRLQAKQKLTFGNAVADVNKIDEHQPSMEAASSIENQSPVKTEMQTQIMPLRSKRVLQKEAETSADSLLEKPNIASSDQDMSASGVDSSSSVSDKPTRMPLRSEGGKSEMSKQSVTQSPQVDNKKLALRSSLAPPSTSALPVARRLSESASPLRIKPERQTKSQVKPHQVSVPSAVPHSSATPGFTTRPEPPKHAANKFFQNLTSEENQHLITNLNVKYDKMLKGWVQMDKEGHPVTKYKNKADRQAAIWKSKRRARKAKSLEHQKYSPVQMLFMKSFNLTNICRWFLDSTETKSLVIVKKVNTRLPSETQLCFHSSSSAAGTSQGLFPSLQAERLKKHLKKFAIASPVKSNAKSQKLIAKALEQEPNIVKGKEKRELQSVPQILAKSNSSEAVLQIVEPQKSCGKSKNPASARILRKYSHIREKMQVQQTNIRRKEGSKTLRTNGMKKLATTRSEQGANLKTSLKAQKAPLQVSKQWKDSEANTEKKEILPRKNMTKHLAQGKAVKTQSSCRASKDATKKELPKRCSQRLGSPKIPEHREVSTPKSKVNNKKTTTETEEVEVEKPQVHKVKAAKIQTKESSQPSAGSENTAEVPQQSTDVKVPTSPDQILTRSQRKIEAAVSLSVSPSPTSKKAAKPSKTQTESPKPVRKAEEHALRRSWALKLPVKRSQAESLPRSANKRNQELLETPAKRTRTSVSK